MYLCEQLHDFTFLPKQQSLAALSGNCIVAQLWSQNRRRNLIFRSQSKSYNSNLLAQ